ncbi:hypothetical protein [Haloarcula sediminis]|nr:hypothetical protein [Haloarcula sp. CK38]
MLSNPDNPRKFTNPLTYAAQLDEASHGVAVYVDSAATSWFDSYDYTRCK